MSWSRSTTARPTQTLARDGRAVAARGAARARDRPRRSTAASAPRWRSGMRATGRLRSSRSSTPSARLELDALRPPRAGASPTSASARISSDRDRSAACGCRRCRQTAGTASPRAGSRNGPRADRTASRNSARSRRSVREIGATGTPSQHRRVDPRASRSRADRCVEKRSKTSVAEHDRRRHRDLDAAGKRVPHVRARRAGN